MWIGMGPEFKGDQIAIPYILYANVRSKPISGSLVIEGIDWFTEAVTLPAMPSLDHPRIEEITRSDQMARQAEYEASL